jgi:hypothetical protein
MAPPRSGVSAPRRLRSKATGRFAHQLTSKKDPSAAKICMSAVPTRSARRVSLLQTPNSLCEPRRHLLERCVRNPAPSDLRAIRPNCQPSLALPGAPEDQQSLREPEGRVDRFKRLMVRVIRSAT